MVVLGDEALNQLFREARTHSAWLDNSMRHVHFYEAFALEFLIYAERV